jgi:hypothetical protein
MIHYLQHPKSEGLLYSIKSQSKHSRGTLDQQYTCFEHLILDAYMYYIKECHVYIQRAPTQTILSSSYFRLNQH